MIADSGDTVHSRCLAMHGGVFGTRCSGRRTVVPVSLALTRWFGGIFCEACFPTPRWVALGWPAAQAGALDGAVMTLISAEARLVTSGLTRDQKIFNVPAEVSTGSGMRISSRTLWWAAISPTGA